MTRRRGNGPPDRFLALLHIEWRGKPGTIRVDNGPEYISEKLMKWAEKQGVAILHIQPGQPQHRAMARPWFKDNGEGLYRALQPHRQARVARPYIIENIEPYGDCQQSPPGQGETQDFATQWLRTYNNDRPLPSHGLQANHERATGNRRHHPRPETENGRVSSTTAPR